MATGVGLVVAILFVISLTNIRVEWALRSGWLVLLVAAIFLSLHIAISWVLIRPLIELDEETGLENLSPGEARQAIDRMSSFVPISAVMAAVNWTLGGLCVAIGVRVLYDVTLSDLIALWMGAISAGMIITVIFHQAIKLRFREVTDLLIRRAQIHSIDDPLFERRRSSLRKELAASFFTLIVVALAFSVMFGYSQTTARVSLTTAKQLGHDLNLFERESARQLGESWSLAADAPALQDLLSRNPPSPGGILFLLEKGAPLLPAGHEEVPLTDDQRELIMSTEGADWIQQRDGSILSWRPLGEARIIAWVPAGDLEVSSREIFATLIILSAILVATMLGVANFLAESITRPLRELRDVMNDLSHGNLLAEHAAGGFTEVGELSVSAAATIESLRQTVVHIRDAHARVDHAAQRVGASTGEVRWASNEQAKLLKSTVESLSGVEESIRNINKSVEKLDRASESSLRSITELNTGTSEVQAGANEVIDAVAETHASIHEMAASIAQVTESMEYLKEISAETAGGTQQMAATVEAVDADARETAMLAEKVLQDARNGQEAVSQTRTGIDRIQSATLEAVNTIQALSGEMGQIGRVLTVIEDVTNQTQLLSLNAAIIAAQAGEHGQGFAVVADEIKKLAVRTAQSTSEIGDMLQRIERQATKGVEKAMAGEEAVREGTALSERARDALAQIERSARDSTERMSRIARATAEQTSGIAHIGEQMDNMVNNVSRVLIATVEQRKGADRISESSDAMRVVAERVGVSAEQQNQNSAAIAESMRQVAEMVDQVLDATRAQLGEVARATGSAKETADLAGRNLTLTEQLKQVVVDLETESRALSDSLQRFKLTVEENGGAD